MHPLLGVDVSTYQGQINWKQVAESGHSFAAIKATEGLGYIDPHFEYNWAHTKANDITRISYHFLRPEFNGAQQASFHHSAVRQHGHFAIGDGVMLDVEETDGYSAHHVVACAEAFVEEILKETQAGVFIYTGYYFWVSTLGNLRSGILAKCPLWEAAWHSAPLDITNWPNGPSLQQYAADGRVPGIPGQTDLDWFFGTKEQLHTLCKLGGRR